MDHARRRPGADLSCVQDMIVRNRSIFRKREWVILLLAAAALGCSVDPVVESVPSAVEPVAESSADPIVETASTAEPPGPEPSGEPARRYEGPVEPSVVMLMVSTSLSMLAEDVVPTRLSGAKEALIGFLDEVPEGTYVGLVSFDGGVTVEVPPTTDLAAVRSAIPGLQAGEANAMGSAIVESIDALNSFISDFGGEAPPARIVLLGDTALNVGQPAGAAIDQARLSGITVSTVAFGTDAGTIDIYEHIDGLPDPVPVDRAALAEIAEGTGGEYFEAETAAALVEIFTELGSITYCDAVIGLMGAPRSDGEIVDVDDYERRLAKVFVLTPHADRRAWALMLRLSEEPFSYENFNPAIDELEGIVPRLERTCLRGLGDQVAVDDSGRIGLSSDILDE